MVEGEQHEKRLEFSPDDPAIGRSDSSLVRRHRGRWSAGASCHCRGLADHYVLGGRYIDDLDRLEDAIAATHLHEVRFEACGAGTSRAHRAATHRFRNLYLDLRDSLIDDTTCQSAPVARAVPVSQRFGQRRSALDEAVDRWWSTLSVP